VLLWLSPEKAGVMSLLRRREGDILAAAGAGKCRAAAGAFRSGYPGVQGDVRLFPGLGYNAGLSA